MSMCENLKSRRQKYTRSTSDRYICSEISVQTHLSTLIIPRHKPQAKHSQKILVPQDVQPFGDKLSPNLMQTFGSSGANADTGTKFSQVSFSLRKVAALPSATGGKISIAHYAALFFCFNSAHLIYSFFVF